MTKRMKRDEEQIALAKGGGELEVAVLEQGELEAGAGIVQGELVFELPCCAGSAPAGSVGDQVRKMAEGFATPEQIAAALAMAPDEIQEMYREQLLRGRALAEQKVRLAQMDLALKGNGPMLIWLGKQYLGQREPRLEVGSAAKKGKELEAERTVREEISFEDACAMEPGELIRLYREALGED